MSGNSESNHDVFLSCLSRERHRIFRFIFSLVPNEADAEDVFQQTSIILWNKFGDYEQDREFYPWACGIALNAVRNFRRASKRHHLLSDDLVFMMAEEQINNSQRDRYRLDLLRECVSQLKRKDQELIKKIYEADEPAKKVADQVGQAVQTIYNRLNRIRKNLLECVNRKSLSSQLNP